MSTSEAPCSDAWTLPSRTARPNLLMQIVVFERISQFRCIPLHRRRLDVKVTTSRRLTAPVAFWRDRSAPTRLRSSVRLGTSLGRRRWYAAGTRSMSG